MEKKGKEEKSESAKEIKNSRRSEILRQKLSNPIRYRWPELTDEVDHQIQLRLSRSFEPYKKCLRRVKKKPPWAIHHWTPNAPPLSQQEEIEKANFKKLFCTGISKVLKCLERDELRLVLIWKATQPAELKKAVLSLVAITGCLAASISDVLHPVKASFEALSSLTAIGIMKSSSPNVFDDLVQYVKTEVPQIQIPELPRINRDRDKLDSVDKPGVSGVKTDMDRGDKPEVAFKDKKSLKRKAEEMPVDLFKYDVKKVEKTGFGREQFIKFSDETATKLVEIDEEDVSNTMKNSFGIAAPLCIPVDDVIKNCVDAHKKTGKKRKYDKSKVNVDSGYKEICIKQLNSNPNKKKKNKFKMKKTK